MIRSVLLVQRVKMGSHLVRSYITERDTSPDPKGPLQHDPQFGFTERKERGVFYTHTQSW